MSTDNRNWIKRILAIVLCTFITVAYMPGLAYALEGQPEDTPEAEELLESMDNAGSMDNVDGTVPEATGEESPAVEVEEEEKTEEEPSEPKAAEPEEPGDQNDEAALTGNGDAGEPEKSIDGEDEREVFFGTVDGLADTDELLESFMEKQISGADSTKKRAKSTGNTRRSKLSEEEQDAYDALQEEVAALVSGDGNDHISEISIEADLDRDTASRVVSALMLDMPYEFFWYDKTEGFYFWEVTDDDSMTSVFLFSVVETYRGDVAWYEEDIDDEPVPVYTFTNVDVPAQAADYAKSIVESVEADDPESDLARLNAYKDEICDLSSYNEAAAHDEIPYGDPWQMIWVFDQNPETEVVCEGYSKAFQYICDCAQAKDYFDSNETECHTVTGNMIDEEEESEELHMWNIVHMEEGNYIADVTNSDDDTIGENGGLFLSRAKEGNPQAGYQFDVDDNDITDLIYEYDSDTFALYEVEELTLLTNTEGSLLDSVWFEDIKNGDGEGSEWAHLYSVDDWDSKIQFEDLNVDIRDEYGNPVDPDKYVLEAYCNSEGGEESNPVDIEEGFGISDESQNNDSGFTEYSLVATAAEDSGYSGDVSGTFYVVDKHSLNFICSDTGFENAIWSGDWRMHQYFKFIEEPDASTVRLSFEKYLDPENQTNLIEGVDYTVTYYVRGADSEDWSEMFSIDNPVDGKPSEPGEYFARISGIGDYYGGNDVMIDIGSMFINEDGSPYLWSNGTKEYTVSSGVEGEIEVKVGINEGDETWDENEDIIFTEGTHYDWDEATLILYGDKVFETLKMYGEARFEIYTYIEDEGDIIASAHAEGEVSEAREDYEKEEDREMLPGWEESIDGTRRAYVENQDHPFGDDFDYYLSSVEIVEGADLLHENTDTYEEEEDGETKTYLARNWDGDGYWFKIIDWDDWVDGDYEESEIQFLVTYEDIYGEEQSYTYTVTVVPEVYEVHLENPDGRLKGLPGHEFDVHAKAWHKYYDKDGQYHDDDNGVNYKWSYAIGSELSEGSNFSHEPAPNEWLPVPKNGLTNKPFADFSITDNTDGHLEFKALTGNQEADEFYVKVELTDRNGEVVIGDWLEFSCVKEYTEIYPSILPDLEVGQKLEGQTFEVRHYSSELPQTGTNDGFETIDPDDVSLRFFGVDQYVVNVTYNGTGEEIVQDYDIDGDTEFDVERIDNRETEFFIEAWTKPADGEEEGDLLAECHYCFNWKDYNIRFDEGWAFVFTDVYDYNKAHEEDEDFEPVYPSDRLPMGDMYGPDWEETFDLVIEAGHYEFGDDGWDWVGDKLVKKSPLHPLNYDYTVETDEETGNVFVTLSESFIESVKSEDDIMINAKLYLKGAEQNKDTLLGSCDSSFNIREPRVDGRDWYEDEDMLPNDGGSIRRWSSVYVENTQSPWGQDFEREVTAVEITDGWEYLEEECVEQKNNKYFLKKQIDENYDASDDEENRGPDAWWDYRAKDRRGVEAAQKETGDTVPAVTFKLSYTEYDNTETTQEFTRTIVNERFFTWIDLEDGYNVGTPGAEFTLVGVAWMESVEEDGHHNGTDKGFTFEFELDEWSKDYAELVHVQGEPVATLRFKNIDTGQWFGETIRVTVKAYRDDGSGTPALVAQNDMNFEMRSWDTELFYTFPDASGQSEKWVSRNINPEILPGESRICKFQLRQYDNDAQGDLQDAHGKYYLIEPPTYSWDYDTDQLRIYSVEEDDETGEPVETLVSPNEEVSGFDTFRFERLTGDDINVRVYTNNGYDEEIDMEIHFDYVDTYLENCDIFLANEVIVNEGWRIVVEDGTSIDEPEFYVGWNGMRLPEEAFTFEIKKIEEWNDQREPVYYDGEVDVLTHGDNSGNEYEVTAKVKDEWEDIYFGEIEPYTFTVYGDKCIEAYHTSFINTETGKPIDWRIDDIESTPYEDWFFVTEEGTSAIPELFWTNGTKLSSDNYTAHYTECSFNLEDNEWQPINEENWADTFPQEAGVYLCVVDGKNGYYGTLQWIDLIRIGDELHIHSLEKIEKTEPTCTEAGNEEYWSCTACDKLFSDAAGMQETMLDGVTIDALGHDPDDGQITKRATATEPGEITYYCKRCKIELPEKGVIPAHDPANTDAENAITAAESLIETGSDADVEAALAEAQTEAGQALDEANTNLDNAIAALEEAQNSGDEEAIAAAQENVNAAEQDVADAKVSKAKAEAIVARVAASKASSKAAAAQATAAAQASSGTDAAVNAAQASVNAASESATAAATAAQTARDAFDAVVAAGYDVSSQEYKNAEKAKDDAETAKVKADNALIAANSTYGSAVVARNTAAAAAAAEAKAKAVKTVTVNSATVSAAAIDKAVKAAGGSEKYVTKIVLGKKVKKIGASAFKKYKKVTTIEVKTKKLTKKGVKKSLKGSKVKTVKVKIGSKKVNKTYITKYKKFFTKANAGKAVKVK